MAKLTNRDKALSWLQRSGRWALYGTIPGGGIGAIGAAVQNDSNSPVFFFGGIFWGAVGLAAMPLAVAVWFMFLHMVRQFSQAVRGEDDDADAD